MLKNTPPDSRRIMIYWRARWRTVNEACALAAEEHRLGNFQAAADIYLLVLGRIPDCAEFHNNRGVALQMMKRFEEALASYDKAIALKSDYANAHFNRGTALKNLNRREDALASYDQALACKPDDAETQNNRAVLLQQLRRYDEAIASYDKAIAAKADHIMAHYNRGTALLSKGDMPEAEKMFRKALQLKPDFPGPLHNLAKMRRYRETNDPDAQTIRALLDKPHVPPEEREELLFALGKIYDDCGRYDEAFQYFRQANHIRNTFVSYNPGAVTKMTDDIIEVFNRDFVAQSQEMGSNGQAPLFIVGMPRSGTTLLAHVLGNHPAIAIAGELTAVDDLASRLGDFVGKQAGYPQAATSLTPAAATRLTADYEKRLRRDVGENAPYVIDKNPLNFRHLGLISILFPLARIIHCGRNSLDTSLSIYFQRFPLSLDFSFDLRNIGHFYREYERLMGHWRMVLPAPPIEVSYEDMVLNTEETTRGLLDRLGLEWDPRCLEPQTNPCPVETASEWQVRQPIYTDSVGRWRHYEKHLREQLIISFGD
jgi:tetratricopeptide (TPR) repeat protein